MTLTGTHMVGDFCRMYDIAEAQETIIWAPEIRAENVLIHEGSLLLTNEKLDGLDIAISLRYQ